jgi:transmembrane sensor
MNGTVKPTPLPTIEEEASDTFVQRLQGDWSPADQAALEARLERDAAFADAYRRVNESWSALDTHAESAQLMGYREEALAYARKLSAGRWLKDNRYARRPWRTAAAAACVALGLATAWQLSPYGYTPGQYATGIGEQRIVELPDHSRITLDATTRLQVRYTKDARLIDLKQGQAQFSVAHDPSRPFKVVAGNQTIIAVGTVFTVEYVDQKIHVAMIEGRVAVIPEQASSAAADSSTLGSSALRIGAIKHASVHSDQQGATIELSAGEELRVARDGHTVITPKADLEAATAWREGKVIIRTEPLSEAVERVNRYSKLQIKIVDERLAGKHVSGVFEAGDTQGFVNAVKQYLPVETDYSESNVVRLSLK